MSGRFSIKGEGASIFFGGDDAVDHEQPPVGHRPVNEVARTNTGTEASRRRGIEPPMNAQTSEPTTAGTDQPASESTDLRANEAAGEPAFFELLMAPLSLKRRLRVMARDRHPHHTSVRISEEERDTLMDICYEVGRKMGMKLTGNDVIRIGLKLLLEDYALRKKESLLVQVLKEEDQY